VEIRVGTPDSTAIPTVSACIRWKMQSDAPVSARAKKTGFPVGVS
jgi:hypothetical protein